MCNTTMYSVSCVSNFKTHGEYPKISNMWNLPDIRYLYWTESNGIAKGGPSGACSHSSINMYKKGVPYQACVKE